MSRMAFCNTIGILLILALLSVAALIRPVRVTTEDRSLVIWCWAWQKGRIDFINSITSRPVMIRFGMPWRFGQFSAETDAGTEDYYTAGLYRWNDAMATQRTAGITYCSEVGVSLTFGNKEIRVRGGCIHAELLWPPS